VLSHGWVQWGVLGFCALLENKSPDTHRVADYQLVEELGIWFFCEWAWLGAGSLCHVGRQATLSIEQPLQAHENKAGRLVTSCGGAKASRSQISSHCWHRRTKTAGLCHLVPVGPIACLLVWVSQS
jgi:hypothetical protein